MLLLNNKTTYTWPLALGNAFTKTAVTFAGYMLGMKREQTTGFGSNNTKQQNIRHLFLRNFLHRLQEFQT